MGQNQQANLNPEHIQARINALLIAIRYADEAEKPIIGKRLKSLQTALEYA